MTSLSLWLLGKSPNCQDWSVSVELLVFMVFSITFEDWSCCCVGCISDFFCSLRITCLGITSSRKLPPYHTDAETLRIWKIICNLYDKKMGTASAMVATVNMAWSTMYMNKRFWSPSKPLKRHHRLFAFCAFFESSLQTQELSKTEEELGKGSAKYYPTKESSKLNFVNSSNHTTND